MREKKMKKNNNLCTESDMSVLKVSQNKEQHK